MPTTYLVTGASRGLGFEFVRHLSQDSQNVAIGLVRNKAAADKKAAEEGLANVHFVEAQYTNLPSLKKAAEVVKQITGGGLDYLINNAALVSAISEFKSLSDFGDNFDILEKELRDSFEINVVGPIKVIEAFLPLIRNGNVKKIITISTGMADINLINDFEIPFGSPYSISKGAVNVAIAKYNAAHKQEGILFLSVSPGFVATERNKQEPNPEDANKTGALVEKFVAYAPHFTRPLTPAESVAAVMAVSQKASIANGDGGAFVSHTGTKSWL
ncbi:hypothetical protein FQN53_008688 [Emmonsiellopsis sp. PD_33]|nr:hypothetical protein FQN53_008688 [Emmonsiellopsis sp. PD_33]KAK2796340.1 hypothetical protein FQN51_009430 [Onygenales sp. PD_10]